MAANVLRNPVHLAPAVAELRAQGLPIPDEHAQHRSPPDGPRSRLTGEDRWEPEATRRPGERRPLRP